MCGLSTCRDSNTFLSIGLLGRRRGARVRGHDALGRFFIRGTHRKLRAVVFFGTSAAPHMGKPDTIFVFDRTFRSVGGHEGLPIRAVLPSPSPRDHDARCTAVFGGKSERFEYAVTSQRLQADLVPVRDADGSVQCGMLILNRARHAPIVRPARI